LCLCRIKKSKCLLNGDRIMDWIWMVWMEPPHAVVESAGPPQGGVDEDKFQAIGISITPRLRTANASVNAFPTSSGRCHPTPQATTTTERELPIHEG